MLSANFAYIAIFSLFILSFKKDNLKQKLTFDLLDWQMFWFIQINPCVAELFVSNFHPFVAGIADTISTGLQN